MSLRIFPLNLGKMKDVERVGIETRDLVGNKDSACRYQKRTPSALDVEKPKQSHADSPSVQTNTQKHLKTHQEEGVHSLPGSFLSYFSWLRCLFNFSPI